MNIFHATYFFGNDIVDHVAWKRHCDYRCKFSFIPHLLRLMMSFSFQKKTFRHNGSAFFGEMCRSSSLVVNTSLEAPKLRLRQHRPFMWIKSFEQTKQVGGVQGSDQFISFNSIQFQFKLDFGFYNSIQFQFKSDSESFNSIPIQLIFFQFQFNSIQILCTVIKDQ